ncbi:hypothetical protein GCK32_019047 [Trichostrongylus colubriformis]|uniref:Phlebovirus glycoprotein G2 fusion domain-containing protein n=1 Tax=Trichostrongylus colubriformis TaxID=6319 RepID=A0AAN8FC99_TRICO
MRTHLQTTKALQSSQSLTEKYWKIWRDHYLTALREQHRLHIDQKQGCTKTPSEGDIVLLSDPLQKRNQWKLAKVIKAVKSSDGAVREAEILCCKRILRRPVNQLFPLEIGADRENTKEHDHQNREAEQTDITQQRRYNLRPRQRKSDMADHSTVNNAMKCTFDKRETPPRLWSTSMYLKMALMLTTIMATGAEDIATKAYNIGNSTLGTVIECRKNGVYLNAPSSEAYELCVNEHCISEHSPPLQKMVRLPPEELLLDFEVIWKLRYKDNYVTIMKTCSAQHFCSTVDCTLCSANILNPECWPVHAIVGIGVILYLLVALCYTICYVPVTVGRPVRLILGGLCGLFYLMIYATTKTVCGTMRFLRRNRRQRNRILEALAVVTLLHCTLACQTVNILSHHMRSCTTSSNRTSCIVEMVSVLQINPFKKNACFRLRRNDSTVMEVRLQWEHLRMLCEKTSLMYTRNVRMEVIDSKRCAHMGSCTRNKCNDVNRTSLLPELALGNTYPGITGCLESCGGPGCECFYWSSCCLFYRTYAVPINNNIYEIFTCTAWKEEVKLRMQIKRRSTNTFDTYTLALQPNVPVEIGTMTLTLSVLAPPPLPEMNTKFITTGETTALLRKETSPTLWSESQVRCQCEDNEIEKTFKDIGNILPVTRSFLKFKRHPRHAVLAEVSRGVSTELTLNVKENVDDMIVDAVGDTCSIDNTLIFGCYSCSRDAVAEIRCKSTKAETSAEIDCNGETFFVPCSSSGQLSRLQFMLTEAQVRMQCSVKCGLKPTHFEITGILKYVHKMHEGLSHAFRHNHNSTAEFRWPDLSHLVTIYLQWYKVVVITVLAIGGALALSYFYLLSACRFTLCLFIKLVVRIITKLAKLTLRFLYHAVKSFVDACSMKSRAELNEKLV